MTTAAPGRLRRALSRWASSTEQLDAADLQTACLQRGATPVAQLEDRCRARVAGTLRTVTLRPRAGVPALEAELYDGSGTLSIVWLGRRQIPGIVPGRGLVAEGMVTVSGGAALMFNPRYVLRPSGS